MQACKYCNHPWHRKAIWCKANIKQLVQHNHTFTTSLQQYDPQQPLQLNWKEAFGPILCNCPLSSRKEAAGLLRSISERLNPPRLALPRTEEERDAGVSMAAARGSSEALRKLAQIVLTWCDCVRRAFIKDARGRMFPPTYCRCLPTTPHASYQFAWVHGGLRSGWSFMARRADTYSCSIMHSASDVGIVAVEWFRCVPCNVGIPSFDLLPGTMVTCHHGAHAHYASWWTNVVKQ